MNKKFLVIALTIINLQVIKAQPENKVVHSSPSKEGISQLIAGFKNPDNEFRPVPLGMQRKLGAQEYVEKLVNGRWGGAHACHPGRGKDYLKSQDGWDFFNGVVNGCREKGLKLWIYDENGYPSGRAGGLVLEGHPEWEAQGLFYDFRQYDIRPSRNNKETQSVEWEIPAGKPFYVACYELNRQGYFIGKPVDLTDSVKEGRVKLSLQPGNWRLVAFVRNRLYEGTHAVLTGGPYINILDPVAVKRFIETTHEAYYSRFGDDFGKTITAVFNDEVSLMNGILKDDSQPYPAIAWYHGLPDLFRKRTGRDIRECLPALFDETGPETGILRCEFYNMLSQQIADSFFKQIREWCARHNIASTGHLLWEESLIYHAHFYGNVFPSYKELDWPGIDELGCQYGCTAGAHTEGGPVTPKLASSAAHIWGKPRTMSESFCFVTNKIPVDEVISHYGWQAVLGINALTTLSIHDAFSDEDLGKLNDFAGRVNFMLTRGRFTADVAILYPVSSVLAEFRPTNRHVHYLNDNPKAKDVDEAWRYVSSQVLSCQRDFDYIDESLMNNAKITDGKIIINGNNYSVLVLPHVTTLPFQTLARIRDFAESGGTVISWKTLPENRADSGSVEEFRSMVEKLWNNNSGNVIHAMTDNVLRNALYKSGKPDFRVTPACPDIYYQHRILPSTDIYYIVNNAKEMVSRSFSFNTRGRAECWNPATGSTTKIESKEISTGTSIELSIPPRESIFVIFNR